MKPPFRADQVGSLLRPAKLREARMKLERGGDELKEIENACIKEAVARQEAIGLQAVTDGDLRRFLQQGGDFSKVTAGSLAVRHPKLIGPDELAAKAVEMMERYSITTLVVVDNAKRIVGVVHLHHLLKHGII